MRRRTLGAGWVVGLGGPPSVDAPTMIIGKRYPATVPGCVHTDLLAAGVIPDPLLGKDELTTSWVGRQDWDYRHDLWWRPDGSDRQELVFEGLDTAAEIWLNGRRLAHVANMHRSYRVDVTGLLHDGSNPLSVRFESAWTYAERMQSRLGARPAAYTAPYNAIRKMACSFGWDWGPATVTAGIWRPAALESWSTARLYGVRPEVAVESDEDGDTGRVRAHVSVRGVAGPRIPLRIRMSLTSPGDASGAAMTATVPSKAADGSDSGDGTDGNTDGNTDDNIETVVELTIPRVRRWWPHDLGEQPLYRLEVHLLGPDGEQLDSWVRSIGFRDITIRTDADQVGIGFTIMINDRPVSVRGVNWIPDDVFPHRVGRGRLADRLAQARDANVNLVRVWGGGLYESEEFYDTCDRMGLLVWQDFALACAAYAEEEPLGGEVEAEAREAVQRLMPHPSLAVWNGNNENIWGFHDWGWPTRLAGRTWGEGYYRDVLPGVVSEVDATRPYWPGSPFSDWAHHPNDDTRGVSHVWDVWNELDYPAYRDRLPRFVAEFGWQAPATWSTLTAAIGQPPTRPDEPALAHRQRAIDGDLKLARGLKRFGIADLDIDDWHFLTQVAQARALSLAVEHYRAHPERCHGMVWWQLNDCWPAISWSVVDSAGRRKPSWHAMRSAYADRLVTLQPLDPLTAIVVAGPDAPWSGSLLLTRRDVSGAVLASAEVPVDCPAGAATRVPVPLDVATAGRPTHEFLVAELEEQRSIWWFVEDAELALPASELTTGVRPRPGGYDVHIHAHTIARDLCLFADRLEPSAQVDRQMVTLLPGESVVLGVDLTDTTGRVVADDAAALTSRPILRATNDAQVQRARLRTHASRRLVGADREGTQS